MIARRSVLQGLAVAAILGAAAVPLPAAADPAVKAIASFSILGDMVHEVGGDRVQVITLVGPDGDAHVYQPTPADARAVAAANVVFVNGLGFEGWIDRLVKSAAFKGPVIVASKGVTPRTVEEEEEEEEEEEHGHDDGHKHDKAAKGADKHDHGHAGHDHGDIDPHAWQSLKNGEIYVRNIADALIAVDPAGAASYRANADRYLAAITALDQEVRAAIATLPEDRRTMVTSHDAFGYFAATYGLTVVAPEGVSTESEASAKDVARLIKQIRAEKIPAVFIENISDPRLIEQIRKETGAAVGGTLYSDALSRPGGPAATYLAMFRHNIAALTQALAM